MKRMKKYKRRQKQTMKTSAAFVLVCISTMHTCIAQEYVHIPDAHLKAAIEDQLWVGDPTPTDMLGLTSLNLSARKIENLTGLEYAKNLHSLQLTHNQVEDLSPLSNLTNLQTLIPNNNRISDLTPLAGLTQLRKLDIHENQIVSIEPLSGLIELEYLNLHENQIRSLSGLSDLRSLQHLDLKNNPVTDLSPLSGLDTLPYLNLSNNQIYDISALSGLSSLSTLYLYNNQISDVSGLSGLTNLKLLSLRNNLLSDISALSGLTGLRELYLNYNQISDVSALSGLTNLSMLWLQDNPLNPQACDVHIPQIMANNPGMTEIQYNPCVGQYSLTLSSSSGGSVAGPGEGYFSYAYGTPVSVTATAHESHHFVSWGGTAVSVGKTANPNMASTTVTVDGNYTLRANFAKDEMGSPAVQTYDAEDLTETTAQLKAHLADDGGEMCDGWFRYWKKGTPAQTELSTPKQPSLQKSQEYTQEIQDLLPDTTYCFQALAENAHGVDQGKAQEFTTSKQQIPPTNLIHVDDDASSDPRPYDPSISDPLEDGTEDHPYDSIQEAIDQSHRFDKIVVQPGRYYETLNLSGKCLEITGFVPGAADILTYPIVDAQSKGPVVTVNQGEDPACVLSGLVLTGGSGNGAAISCVGASPTIKNCLIVGNRSTDPDGAIIYCEDSQSRFENLTVCGNTSAYSGSAFRFTDCAATIASSILWGNLPEEIIVAAGHDPGVSYSNVQGTWPGPGNIATDPLFAGSNHGGSSKRLNANWTPDDYHLLSETGRWSTQHFIWMADQLSSPCIDGGDPSRACTAEPRPNGGRINMGAYGGTDQASLSLHLTPIVAHWTFDESSGNTASDAIGDNHGTVNGAAWASGILDGALHFDGIDDYVDCGNDQALAPDQFTLSMWLRAQASSTSRTILRKAGGDMDKDYEFELFGARYPTFSFGNGFQSVVLYSSSKLPLNEWTQVVLTRGESEAAIHINGAQVVSKTFDIALSATDHKLIVGGGFRQPYEGKIDDVQIYDAALPIEDIKDLAHGAD